MIYVLQVETHLQQQKMAVGSSHPLKKSCKSVLNNKDEDNENDDSPGKKQLEQGMEKRTVQELYSPKKKNYRNSFQTSGWIQLRVKIGRKLYFWVS